MDKVYRLSHLSLLLDDLPHLVMHALNLAALSLCLLTKRNLAVVVTEITRHLRTDDDGKHQQSRCKDNVLSIHILYN